MTFELSVLGTLRAEVQSGGRDVCFVDASGHCALTYAGLRAFDAEGRDLPARLEATAGGLALTVDDAGARYPITIDPVAQQAYLKASNTSSADEFGQNLAVSGNTVVVGARGEDSNATGVNGNQSDNSATSSGAAYVFVRSQGAWSQEAYLKASNTGASDSFGFAVAIEGDTIVIGAPNEDSSSVGVNGDGSNDGATNSGAAYVYVRSGGAWTQQAYLKASNTDAFDSFGFSVSISGDTIVVGAPGEASISTGVNGNQNDNSLAQTGAAYVFVRSGAAWSQQAYLKASNTGFQDAFGTTVRASGDTVVVAAPAEDSNATGVNGNQSDNSALDSGAAYVFVRNGTTWSQQAYLKASNTEAFDRLGDFKGLAISGDTIVVAAPQEDSNATGVNGAQSNNGAPDSGAAYVFVRSGTTWSQQAYFKASNTGAFDNFGQAVSVSGDVVAVGAGGEASLATGVNGNQADNSLTAAGAVYVFTRAGGTWSQLAYVKASNTGSADVFGISVGVSGDLLVVGAFHEDSAATGVNGNQADESQADSGAAYAFDLDRKPGTVAYGTGTPGCSGAHALGVTHAPMINAPQFAITCDNAPPSSLGLGLVTNSQDLAGSDPFGIGVLLHSDLLFATEVLSFDFYSNGTGYAETVGAPIPNNPALIGATYYACAVWFWTSCALPPNNLSSSRGLAITILVP